MATVTSAQASMPRRSNALGVHSLNRFVFSVPDLAPAEAFYKAFGLDVRRDGGRLDLYTFGHPHCWGSVHANGQPKRLQYLCFSAYAEDYDALAQRMHGAGAADPHPLSDGQGAWTRDADGTPIQVVVGPKVSPAVKATVTRVPPPAPGKGAAPGRSAAPAVRPRRLSHCLLFSPDVPRQVAFYERVLGLRLADRSGDVIAFMYGPHASDHHMVAFAKSEAPGLHHSSWDVGSIDDVGLGAEQMRGKGYTHGWGVGRHVLGSNYFHYVQDPWGSWAEYSHDIDFVPAELEWPAADHPPEDSFYVWGPSVPDDFIVNREQPRAAGPGGAQERRQAARGDPRRRGNAGGNDHEGGVSMRTGHRLTRWLGAAACAFALLSDGALAQGGQPPIRIGSTLALTGPLAATGLVHKVVGEIYVEQLNKRGGLLGRQVEWIVRDDQSKPDLARTLYEQLLTVDKVDLLMGPYATGAILSAMGVAQRYNKVLIHHTFGIPSLAKYDKQFPAWSLGADPANTVPNTVFDALAASSKPPKTIAVVTSKFPSVHFMSLGAREVAKKRGLSEVLFLEWDFGNLDYAPIAARIKDAKPDFIWVGAIGLEGNQLLDAMSKIDYAPVEHFYMYPAPGPMSKSPLAKNALSMTVFEEHPPYSNAPGAKEFIELYHERAAKAGIPDTNVEVQAAASYTAWQLLEAAVRGTNSLDDAKMAAWLKANKVDTIQGKLRFDGPSNYGDDLMRVKQVQNGRWVTVYPKEFAAPGATLQVQ